MRSYKAFISFLLLLMSYGSFGQELLEVESLEEGTIKSFIFLEADGAFKGKWYMYLSPTDSMLIADGPLLYDKEEGRYLQNGLWTFDNGSSKPSRSAYVVGEEHFSALRESYFAGQSYSPIPLFIYDRKEIRKQESLVFDEDLVSLACGHMDEGFTYRLPDTQCEDGAIITLPNLVLKENEKRLSAQAFSFEMNLSTPRLGQKDQSSPYFFVDLGGASNNSYRLKALHSGDLELGFFADGFFTKLFTLPNVLKSDALNKISIQFDTEGVFVLKANDQLISTRAFEFNNQIPSELGTIAGDENKIVLLSDTKIDFINLSMFQFSEDPLNNLPFIYYKDLLEISLGLINGQLSQSANEVYLSEISIQELKSTNRVQNSDLNVLLCLSYPIKEIGKSNYKELTFRYQMDDLNNKVKSISYFENGEEKELDVSLLGSQLNRKFGNKVYTFQDGLNHPNVMRKGKQLILPPQIDPTGEFYLLVAKTSLRKGPSSRDQVLLRFRPDNKVELIKRINKYWWQVSYKNNIGFVKAALLKPVK